MNATLGDEERHEFVRELVIVARRWRNRLDERLKSIGMSQARWAALYWLASSPDGLTQTALAERAGVEAPTLVRIIDLLEEQGLVERRISVRDRRSKIVHLTPAATPVVAEIEKVAGTLRAEVLEDVSPEELRLMLRTLQQLRGRLGPDGGERTGAADAGAL